MDKPAEGGHWYRRDGTPAYTITGKNGEERPTTLRDARKLGLVPSVTTIIKCAAAPGLTNWIIDQHIMACLTTERQEGESDEALIARIKLDAGEQAKKARERGTQIHAWVQQGFEGTMILGDPDNRYYVNTADTLNAECGVQEWIPERSFATRSYGGKCDLHNDAYLIDIKTTDKDLAAVKTWDEHHMQLAAYDAGLGGATRKCGILYIHVHTAESKIIWITDDEWNRGLECFISLTHYWYAKNRMEAK